VRSTFAFTRQAAKAAAVSMLAGSLLAFGQATRPQPGSSDFNVAPPKDEILGNRKNAEPATG
jgi:hypothetical protein